MALNKHVKRKWLKALRSGEYRKGGGALCWVRGGERTYCCLGVLVEEMVPEFGVVKDVFGYEKMTVGGSTGYLPDDLGIMFGLSHHEQQVLANKNDDANTFLPVIQYIEDSL